MKNLINGKTISEKSKTKFNNQRLLIADFEQAEKFVKQTFEKFGLSTKNSEGIIQQRDMSEGGLSEVERRILTELFSRIGINQIYIDESLLNLTERQLDKY